MTSDLESRLAARFWPWSTLCCAGRPVPSLTGDSFPGRGRSLPAHSGATADLLPHLPQPTCSSLNALWGALTFRLLLEETARCRHPGCAWTAAENVRQLITRSPCQVTGDAPQPWRCDELGQVFRRKTCSSRGSRVLPWTTLLYADESGKRGLSAAVSGHRGRTQAWSPEGVCHGDDA